MGQVRFRGASLKRICVLVSFVCIVYLHHMNTEGSISHSEPSKWGMMFYSTQLYVHVTVLTLYKNWVLQAAVFDSRHPRLDKSPESSAANRALLPEVCTVDMLLCFPTKHCIVSSILCMTTRTRYNLFGQNGHGDVLGSTYHVATK